VGELVLGLGEVRVGVVALGLVFAHGAEDPIISGVMPMAISMMVSSVGSPASWAGIR
jgi:hypothetical protein